LQSNLSKEKKISVHKLECKRGFNT